MFQDEIKTERLILRDITAADVDAVQVYASDPAVTRFMVWGPNTPTDSWNFVKEQLEAQAADDRRVFNKMVVRADNGLLIGAIELRLLNRLHQRAEFGYVYRSDQWGQGFATEAAQALVAFGFEELGLQRIEATCDPENQASANVLRKTGLTLEGRMRNHMKIRGRWRDSLLFARLRDD
ncbi:GNAT family N-acetyltransferase [Kineosporia babensis]|uniref:GNAT family N-acetyltransferase n=1 Tax=Kineosporia babensis TaxID=499548 RepID=A0A9X1SV33_9ACTN|nr:GNAT family protein [Kineosporia babensis]MCD5312385.1 GNAT family N-acetyltransferase [Kineosporia babensis]